MNETKGKGRIRGVPGPDSRLTLLAAILLAAWAVLSWIVGNMDFFNYRLFGARMDIISCLLMIADSVLLVLGRKRLAPYLVGVVLLWIAVIGITESSWLILAVLLILLSAIGLPFNRVWVSGPKWLRAPLLNLISAGLAVLHILGSLNFSYYDYWEDETITLEAGPAAVKILLAVLLTAGVILLNLGSEGQLLRKGAKDGKIRAPRLKTVPRSNAGGLVIAGAILVLLNGVWTLLPMLSGGGIVYSVMDMLWPLAVVAAGILMLVKEKREKFYLPAVLLVLLNQLHSVVSLNSILRQLGSGSIQDRQRMNLLLLLALLLMLIGAVGVTWNRSMSNKSGTRKLPILNLIAGILVIVCVLLFFMLYLGAYETADGGSGFGALLRNQWYMLALFAGLILWNLAVETKEIPRKDKGMVRKGKLRFYDDVGGKIQKLAKICGFIWLIVGAISAFFAALGLLIFLLQMVGLFDPYLDASGFILSGLIGLAASLLMAIGTWPLYAFGQITSDVRSMKGNNFTEKTDDKEEKTSESVQPAAWEGTAVQPENPDDLPEL